MTLRELRISKGLNQNQCAKYLGMSTRNYQNYENSELKVNTAKYNQIYKMLENYEKKLDVSRLNENIYNTNVITGEKIVSLIKQVRKYKKRDCFNLIERFISEEYNGKICILYGLRRTGKTTLLFQMIEKLPLDKTAYIKVQTTNNMSELTKDLNYLYNSGVKYVFIDEITLMEDFINTAAILSDIFGMIGMKIVVSGTDSLGFNMASSEELYDRAVMIHTSYIPFKEYSRLLDINSIDTYIEYGGTLKVENMSFDDLESAFDEVSFRNDETTRKYIDTAISRNIQNTLKNYCHGEYFNQLRELFDKGELTNVINRIVESVNHEFLLSVVTEKFKSHDLGSSKELLLHDFPEKRATVLYDIDEKKVIERLKNIIDIKEKNETKIEVTEDHIEKIKKYLLKLDLLVTCYERYEGKSQGEINIITQPGMRYAISKALVYSLLQDEYFKTISEYDKKYIIDKILSDVKGRMLEDIVLLECYKKFVKDKYVFKFKFDNGGEYDMVIYNKVDNTCRIYEIKHATAVNERQVRYLNDKDKCDVVEKRFGKIVGKYVLYRGDDKHINGVEYLNVEKFLCE